MAKERATYLSNMNGRVGNIVVRNYRDGVVVGVRPRKSGKAPSKTLLENRMRFSEMARLAKAFAPALTVGMTNMPDGMMGSRNVFSKKNWPHVTINGDGVLTVDYSKLQLTNGSLSAPAFSTPKLDGDLVVEVSFAAVEGATDTSADDLVYLYVYQAEVGLGMMSAAVPRSAAKVSVRVPAAWSGTEVHIYGFAVGGGRLNYGRSSYTVYLGKGTVE